MNKYITTITFTTHAENEEQAVKKSAAIAKNLHREHGNNAEIETIEHYRTFGLNNKQVDFHRIIKEQKDSNINQLEDLEQ